MVPPSLVVKVGRPDAELADVGVERVEVEAHRAKEVHSARLVAYIASEGYFGQMVCDHLQGGPSARGLGYVDSVSSQDNLQMKHN